MTTINELGNNLAAAHQRMLDLIEDMEMSRTKIKEDREALLTIMGEVFNRIDNVLHAHVAQMRATIGMDDDQDNKRMAAE